MVTMHILYWFKFLFIWILAKLRPYLSSTSTSGFGKRRNFTIVEKEQVRDLSINELTIDASYFNAFDHKGRFLGLGMQKRLDNRCENVFFIRIPELIEEPLVLSINPSTWTSHVIDEWKTDKGLSFEMREPMKRWKIIFDGDVVEVASRKPHKLKFEFEWNRKSVCFDADTDMDPNVMAHAIASEKWSKSFFNNLKELHQTHYEIFGELSGKISVDNNPDIEWNLISMKDRSYGKHRFWGDFRRYILHYIATEDGLYIGCHFVSITKTFTHLLVGFVLNNKGEKYVITTSNQTLWDIGENELPFKYPYCFTITDNHGKQYKIQIQIMEKIKFYCGPDRDGTLFSAYVTGTVNGVKASGLCEYEYNSTIFSRMLKD